MVGIAALARTEDGRVILIRRGDTGEWAMPGGTLEWGETLRDSIVRELLEEAGVDTLSLGDRPSVYSRPDRDLRFHAVTVVVPALVKPPHRPPVNPLEILEVRAFLPDEIPRPLAYAGDDMLDHALAERAYWE